MVFCSTKTTLEMLKLSIYTNLLWEMPRYCCSVERFISDMIKIYSCLSILPRRESAVKCLSQKNNRIIKVRVEARLFRLWLPLKRRCYAGHAVVWNEIEFFHIPYHSKSFIPKIFPFYIPYLFHTLYNIKKSKFYTM